MSAPPDSIKENVSRPAPAAPDGIVKEKEMAKVIAVCTSRNKGERKQDIGECLVEAGFGLNGDAHAGTDTHRQVSLLDIASIEKMRLKGIEVGPGDFAENLTTEGIEVAALPVGAVLQVGEEVVLEITQIGKECHSGCAIMQQAGTCIMPKEGVFARVLRGGRLRKNDAVSFSPADASP